MAQHVILATLVFVATLAISFAVALTILIRLPPDYFRTPRAQNFQEDRHGLFFRIGMVLRNLLGAILIVIGVILSVPGLPGQGLLTVLAGVFLLDFPGKRKLLYEMLRRPLLLQAKNRLRTKFSRPPLGIGRLAGGTTPREEHDMLKVLLPVDGSESAARATQKLVETLGWYKEQPAVDLLAVHLPVPRFPNMSVVISDEMLERYYAEECEVMLAPSRKALDAAGVKYIAYTRVGPVAENIVEQAKQSGSNMIWARAA